MLRLLWLWVSCAFLTLSAAEPVNVGSRRQLLIDHRFIESGRNVSLLVHQPVKTGDITIGAEPGFDLGGYNTVLYTDGLYRMWYSAGPGVLYATSRDGIHWDRPALRLTTGTSPLPNNVVLGDGAGGVNGGVHGLMVFVDPNAPAAERFRLVTNPEEFHSFLQIFSSPDGIHWRHTHRDVLVFDSAVKPHHLDSQNVIFWDERIGKYVVYFRKNLRVNNSQGRSVARGEAQTLSFGHVKDWQPVYRADERHPGHDDPVRKTHSAVLDVYTNGAIAYPWAEDAYFLFPTIYYHYGAFQPEFREHAPVNAGIIDVRFASSRDGIHWDSYNFEPFVPLGMQGAFDSRRIYMARGIVPALNGREMYMYYMGTDETHGWGRDDRNNGILTAAGLAPAPERRAISRVVLRRDGFVSAHVDPKGGEFTTPAMRFEGDQLVLNVDTSAAGEAKVEVQDVEGNPYPGFTLADADMIHSTNAISRPVSWKGATTLEKLAGKAVRLHFVVRGADLYAFEFRNRPAL